MRQRICLCGSAQILRDFRLHYVSTYVCRHPSFLLVFLYYFISTYLSLSSFLCPVPCLSFIFLFLTRLPSLSSSPSPTSYFSSTSYAGSVIVAAVCAAANSFLPSPSRSLSMTYKAAVASHLSIRKFSSITSSIAGLKVGRSTSAAATPFASVKTDGRPAYLMDISRLPVLCAFVIHESTWCTSQQ